MSAYFAIYPMLRTAVAACVGIAPAGLWAQQASSVRDGSFEISVMAGDTIGGLVPANIDLANFHGLRVKSPGRGAFGVGVAIAANSKLLLYGQVSAFRGEHRDTVLAQDYLVSTNLLNLVYEGGLERFFPTRSKSLVFYGLWAAASIQKRVDAIVNYANTNPNPAPGDVLGAATRVRLKDAVFAPALGAGMRYYVGSLIGFKIETKVYFPTGDVTRPTGVATAGFFLDLPKRLQ